MTISNVQEEPMRYATVLEIDGRLFTRKLLKERYSISYDTLRNWVRLLGINPPKPGQAFATEDVIALDELWIALRLEGLSPREYENLLENGMSLERYLIQRYWDKNLASYLYNQIKLDTSIVTHPVIVETLKRKLTTSTTNQEGKPSYDE